LKLKVEPIASESLGVRSMCVFVEASNFKILLDAGATLGPRFGLLPHPKEYEELKKVKSRIRRKAKEANLITVSHYHYDHYTPCFKQIETRYSWNSYEESKRVYEGKVIYAKDYRSKINPSQRRRGYLFAKIAKGFASEIKYVDGKAFRFKDVIVSFTKPKPHGEDDSFLGYVLLTQIRYKDEKLLFAPDIQGSISVNTLRQISRMNPKMLIVGGPPTYLADSRVERGILNQAIRNMKLLVAKISLTIIDHHLLRDKGSLKIVDELRDEARKYGNRVETYASYLGKKERLLEANRKELYEVYKPRQEFLKWMKLPPQKQRLLLPPI
jgi:hypothetical protein